MITIVTDSSSCIKKSEAQELNISIIPNNYTVNGQSYSESYSDQNGGFESILKGKASFSTSHPNMSAFLSCFEEEKNSEILCVTLSSRLSGAYGTAYMAANQVKNKNIAVFDSQLTAGGLYLLIKEARKLEQQGMGLRELTERLPAVRERINIAFSVDDMDPLRRSGRLGFVRMSVSTILNIRPILLCRDGAVTFDCTARGKSELVEKLMQKISADASEVVLSYIGDNNIATDLYNVIHDRYPHTAITFQRIGPVLGIHLGLRVVAVSVLA